MKLGTVILLVVLAWIIGIVLFAVQHSIGLSIPGLLEFPSSVSSSGFGGG